MDRSWWMVATLTTIALTGCFDADPDEGPDDMTGPLDGGHIDLAQVADATFERRVLPSVFPGHGLYEPTIDVGGDGAIYYSAHSQNVGENPAPAYYSLDDGVTWQSMAYIDDSQAPPEEQGSAPFQSDEIFIVATEDGEAWGADCCNNGFPLVGWTDHGATTEYYNHNAFDHTQVVTGATECIASGRGGTITDRPWLAYANDKLLMVNNPGGGRLQIGSMDLPPPTALAYEGKTWLIDWNLCASSGGWIPGIPDMRDDHFFASPQLVYNSGCEVDHYLVMTGNADDMGTITETIVMQNTHIAPAEDDSTPSQVGPYGQIVFDATGTLYLGAMNNTASGCGGDDVVPVDGGLHFAVSTDDGASYTETTFRFDKPVSSIYMDGNKQGAGFLLNWGVIDGNHTDWYVAHVYANDDGTLRMENVMLAVDDGPEASRHVQGAALGPDGRAYLALSRNSSNPGGATVEVGDTPLEVAVQLSGPTMPLS